MPRPRSVDQVANRRTVRHGQLTLENFEAPAGGADVSAKSARYHALHDKLTRLPNGEQLRAMLDQALGRVDAPHPALALLHVSINLADFKASIDAYGPDAGDELLARMAARLAGAARAEDLFCRLENDQFACLVPGLARREQLRDLANRLLDSVPFPLRIGILQLCVRPSIGIAVHPGDGMSVESMLANAEVAMRRAKRRDPSYAFADEG